MNISPEPERQHLRHALDEITALPPRQLPRHPALVAGLNLTHPHSINVASDPEVADVPLKKFTCFMHAFGLVHSTAVIKIARTFTETYPSGEFVAFLIDGYLSEGRPTEACDGDVVVYFNGDRITHAGQLRAGRILSKWGTRAPLGTQGLRGPRSIRRRGQVLSCNRQAHSRRGIRGLRETA